MSAIDVQNYPYPFFAREGWPFIVISLLVFVALVILDLFFGAFLAFILSVFTFQFFRDPKRSGPKDDSVITSPADGRVIFIGKSLDPLQNTEALKISVFMNVFNVHSNRSPIEGTIKSVDYQSGNFLMRIWIRLLNKMKETRYFLWIKVEEDLRVSKLLA